MSVRNTLRGRIWIAAGAEGSADVAGVFFLCLSMQALYCGSPNSGKLLTLADEVIE
jgi:hypothetical protein